MKASIIISVYKNVDALQQVLESLRLQTERDFEVIISEDGCDNEMCKFVETYNWFCPHQHLIQEDKGWRKNRALNRAILKAKSDWLIFIDGDCIVHSNFVEMHLYYANKNRILLGKRVKLSEQLSKKVLSDKISIEELGWSMWNKLLFKGGCRYVDEGIFIPFKLDKTLRSVKHLTGCNMSFSKEAIVSINGFDEDYIKPAVGEDADIDWRFRAAGYEFVSVRNRAIEYHLYHKDNWTDQSDNLALMKKKIIENKIFCDNGLSLHEDGH